jgi:hypothetical protein
MKDGDFSLGCGGVDRVARADVEVDQNIDVHLLHVRKQASVRGKRSTSDRRRQVLQRIMVVMSGKYELLQVIGALPASACFARRLHGRKQKSDQDTDNCNDDEQFHQREATMFA